jgi:formiminotetrahydrofolate cyclodeaminase
LATTSANAPIADRLIGVYLDTLASAAPAPGGGSAAGVAGALAAALTEMVCNITLSHDLPPTIDHELRSARDEATSLRGHFLALGEEDEVAYRGYAAAVAMPKQTAEEKTARRLTIQAALREAAEAPLRLAENCVALLDVLAPVMRHGNTYVLSDAIIAIRLVEAAIAAAVLNVNANVRLMKNASDAAHYKHRIDELEHAARATVATLLEISTTR